MRKILSFGILGLFLSAQSVGAHEPGTGTLFTIDGEAPVAHPLSEENITSSAITLPKTIMAEIYLVNQPINFSLDDHLLGELFPQEEYGEVTYQWDFGDGTKGSGLANTHTFTEAGSFVVTIQALFTASDRQPETIEQVQLNIYPDMNYQLAQPRISVNGHSFDGSTIEANLQQPVKFEAVIANEASADIASYQWDFGDGTIREGQAVVYAYPDSPLFATPILRVIDENGLISDTHAMVAGSQNTGGTTYSTSMAGLIILLVQAAIVVAGVIIYVIIMWQNRKRTKRKH